MVEQFINDRGNAAKLREMGAAAGQYIDAKNRIINAFHWRYRAQCRHQIGVDLVYNAAVRRSSQQQQPLFFSDIFAIATIAFQQFVNGRPANKLANCFCPLLRAEIDLDES